MNIFTNLWYNWTSTEKIFTLLLFSILFVLIPSFLHYITRNRSITLFSILSLISGALITILGILFLNLVLSITVTYIFLLTPVIVLFLNLLNISTCIGYYKKIKKEENFVATELRREFFRDSIQISIFILLLFSALSIFLSGIYLTFILLSGIISLITIWINYTILYKLLK